LVNPEHFVNIDFDLSFEDVENADKLYPKLMEKCYGESQEKLKLL